MLAIIFGTFIITRTIDIRSMVNIEDVYKEKYLDLYEEYLELEVYANHLENDIDIEIENRMLKEYRDLYDKVTEYE